MFHKGTQKYTYQTKQDINKSQLNKLSIGENVNLVGGYPCSQIHQPMTKLSIYQFLT